MKIPLLDLVAQYKNIKNDIDRAVIGVLESGGYVQGANVRLLEEEVAAYTGSKHAVGVASGTDALFLALKAYGIGPGDEVVVPSFTFFATSEAVSNTGAVPVFTDIDMATYCIDVNEIEKKITERTKAIIPVHLFGHPSDMDPIMNLAHKHGVKVIEDNAQALGCDYKGKKTGSIGHVGCLSFFPSKNLGGCGDGGMVLTDDGTVAEKVRQLKTHGWAVKYEPKMLGYNSRLDELQAAILRVKLPHLDRWNEARHAIAGRYAGLMSGDGVFLPQESSHARHVYHLYVIRVSHRQTVQEYLKSSGIACGVYYPKPLHLLDPYLHFDFKDGDFPSSERCSSECLAIPLYPDMSEDQISAVASGVCEAVKRSRVANRGVLSQ
ncbi:DegT/DnrJ/EryC1/StrS family aminotransferase [Elusimicrobiota bacterium]